MNIWDNHNHLNVIIKEVKHNKEFNECGTFAFSNIPMTVKIGTL